VILVPADSIAALLSHCSAVKGQKPWPRYVVDPRTWEQIGKALARGKGDLLALWGERETAHMALRTPPRLPCVISLPMANGEFPSIGAHHAPAIRLERTACDL
jgi:hypothetical protein